MRTLPRSFLFLTVLAAAELSSAYGAEWETTLSKLPAKPFLELRPLRARYSFGWAGFTAATADLHFETGNGRLQLTGAGKTIGLVRSLWAYDLENKSLTDAQTLRPIEVREVETLRAKQTTTELKFSEQGVEGSREERKGEAVSSKKGRFEFADLHSLSSALLFLRAQPLSNGDVERVIAYPTSSAYLCTLTVVGREKIAVPAGTFDAIKMTAQLSKVEKDRTLSPHKKVRNATVWLSDDANRLLLRIEAQIFVGKVYTQLQSVQFDPPDPAPARR